MGDKIIRASFAAFDGIDAPDKVPTEIRLLSAGSNAVDGDDGVVFDDAAAKSVMQRYAARGLTLKADYEHQSLANPPVIAPASAKKWVPEVRDGALYATQIQWTKKARQMIADGEYDYFSIAARVDTKSRRVIEMINFALTNTPAANGIDRLVAASAFTPRTENDMKTVIVALGLRADAEEAEAIAAATSLKDFERDVLSSTGKQDRAGAIVAMRAALAESETAKAELLALKKSTVDAEAKRLIDTATTEGRLPPAMRASAEAQYTASGIAALTLTLSMLPQKVGGAAPKAPVGAPKDKVIAANVSDVDDVITALDVQFAKKLIGEDPEKLDAHLGALRAYRAQRESGTERMTAAARAIKSTTVATGAGR